VRAATDATHRLADVQATSQAKLVDLLTQSLYTNAGMLERLQAMANAAQSTQSPDWIPVSFRLTLETADGPPAAGYEATLVSASAGLFDQGIRRESDSNGLVDFGVVHPGDWQFLLSKSCENGHKCKCQGSINVLPRAKVLKTIVCPKPAPEQVQCQVKLRVQWPADLANKNLVVLAAFEQQPTTFQPPLKWSIVDSAEKLQARSLITGPGLRQMEIGGQTELALWYSPRQAQGVARVFGDLRSPGVQSEPTAIALEAGGFFFQQLLVLQPRVRRKNTLNGERFEVLAFTESSDLYEPSVDAYSSDPDDDGDISSGRMSLPSFMGGVNLGPCGLYMPFLARPGQVNEWTLEMPPEVVSVVRDRLANKSNSKARIPSPGTTPDVDLK
jgi:hypothetical protein